jgi:hypothetical protein
MNRAGSFKEQQETVSWSIILCLNIEMKCAKRSCLLFKLLNGRVLNGVAK